MADNVGSKVTYFLVGLGVGALVGILFAPKTGEETRDFLSKKADEGKDYAQRKARELRERAGHKVEIVTPQRGSKRAFLDLVENNAKHSFEQRFRVLKPTSKAIGEALQNALNLAEEPRRIESFDISHIQGTDTVASMVVWENGRRKKAD